MAIGINFLSKTSGMKDIMGGKTASVGQNNANASSVFQNISDNKAQKTGNADVASMDTSSLIKYVIIGCLFILNLLSSSVI